MAIQENGRLIDTDLDVEIFAPVVQGAPQAGERHLIDTDLDVEVYSDGTTEDGVVFQASVSQESGK